MGFVADDLLGAGDERPQVFETAGQGPVARDPAPARCRARSPRPVPRAPADPAGRRAAGRAGCSGRRRRRRARGVRRVRTARRPARRRSRTPRRGWPRCCGPARPGRPAPARRARGTSSAIRAGMSPGGRNRGSWTSKTLTWPVVGRSLVEQRAEVARVPHARRVSESSQVPITLVRKRTRPSTPPSLVKLAARLASVTTGWSSSTPTSPHVPQETYAASGSVIGTPTTAEAVSWEPTVTTGVPSCCTDDGARVDQLGQLGRVEADQAEQLGVPLARVHVEQPGGRGVRALADGPAGERPGDQVGDQQQLLRLGQPALGRQLVDRVERQELQPGAAVELVGTDAGVHRLDPGCRPPVAVAPRQVEQLATAQQPVVDRPRVHADARHRPRRPKTGQAVVEQRREVPVQPVGAGRPGRWGTGPRSRSTARPARRSPGRPARWTRPGRPRRRRRSSLRRLRGSLRSHLSHRAGRR